MKNHVHKEAPPGMKHHRNYGKYLYTAFLAFTLIACNVQPVMAATIWDKASEIMKDVYNQIILISTIAAVVTASVALLLMNFSKSGKPWMNPGHGSNESSLHGRFSMVWDLSWLTLHRSLPAGSGMDNADKEVALSWEYLTEL